MILYDYFRSTASYRVRIALNLKNISYTKKEIHLTKNGGEQHTKEYRVINPQQLVPSLKWNDHTLTQSLAILEYLEETYPSPALLPVDTFERGIVRSMAQIVVSDMHPLNNLRVLNYLQQSLHVSEEGKNNWYHHWLRSGFDALEAFAKRYSAKQKTCFKDQISIADVCLIPQLFNARRFEFPLGNYPTLCQIEGYCLSLPEFQKAHPSSD